MTRLLKASGGELLLGTAVERIDTDGKAPRACGSPTAAFERASAVIANVHPQLVFGKLLPPTQRPPSSTRDRRLPRRARAR